MHYSVFTVHITCPGIIHKYVNSQLITIHHVLYVATCKNREHPCMIENWQTSLPSYTNNIIECPYQDSYWHKIY